MADDESGTGSGSSLPTVLLILAGLSTGFSVVVSCISIYLHLKNYLKPSLQRMVIRIMVMVPIYGLASLISLFSLNAAFFIDAVRDIYEAFVIYCFFVLLVSYLGGERSLLILLHGRQPKSPVFPLNLWRKEIDISDPTTFLFLKRGILQYVQVKPILAIVEMILKAAGVYNDGDFRANSGYLYVSIIYNFSIGLSLYCLAVFWMCLSQDLQPYRPMPKFLCVKGILFFSFWQGIFISILVAAGAIKALGPYTDAEHISIAMTDLLVCLEMPFFAIAHLYAFSYHDYIDRDRAFVARMPMYYAFRDSFGILDVVQDSKHTLKGEGMDYRDFEPSEGHMHQGEGRDRRIRAGLRYSKGGTKKYWLPQTDRTTAAPLGRFARGVNTVVKRVAGDSQGYDPEVHAPLLENDDDATPISLAPDLLPPGDPAYADPWAGNSKRPDDLGYDLPFDDPDAGLDDDDALYDHSRKNIFGDYNYPCIDISSETARNFMWDEEERILRNERDWRTIRRGGPLHLNYGATGSNVAIHQPSTSSQRSSNTTAKGKHKIHNGHDRIAASPSDSSEDARLRWLKHRKDDNIVGTPRERKTSAQSSSSGSPARKSPQVNKKSAALPPDAIDLVVEDDEAEEEELMNDRAKGEPALRGGAQKKVYRRGFVIEDSDNEEEEDHHPSRPETPLPPNSPQKAATMGSREVEVTDHGESEIVSELAGAIARTETPPPHAQTSDDSNPWAS